MRPGDFAVLDEAEKGIVVIPKDKLVELAGILPGLKEADEGVLRDVRAGFGWKEVRGGEDWGNYFFAVKRLG